MVKTASRVFILRLVDRFETFLRKKTGSFPKTTYRVIRERAAVINGRMGSRQYASFVIEAV
jgi:hypothetical protein